MVTRDFSGSEIVSVLVNKGNFWVDRITGDHYILKWEHPQGSEVEKRTVSVPYHEYVVVVERRTLLAASDAGSLKFMDFELTV